MAKFHAATVHLSCSLTLHHVSNVFTKAAPAVSPLLLIKAYVAGYYLRGDILQTKTN